MSSLTGIAQFTNRFAQNIMGYKEEKEKEAERLADKQREQARQDRQELRTQQNHDVTLGSNQIKLEQDKVAHDEFKDATTFAKTGNQLKQLKAIGAPEEQSIDVLSNAINSNTKLPYKIEFERDVTTGKVIQRQDAEGKPFYFQSIVDKETGEVIGRKATTLDEAVNSYTQLQRGGAIEAEIEAAKSAREAAKQKVQDELSLYKGKALVDDAKDANKQQREHIYKVDEMGIKHGYTVDELGVKHGFLIDELGVRHANAVDLANVNAQNNIGIRTAQADLDSGGTPIVGGPAWGSFDALIGPESGGNQLDSNGRPLTSSAGAIGIAQVMPDTAKYVANKHKIPWDENRYKTDPDYNYQLGKLYYEEQLNKYGHPALAYAAYNAGPGNVDKWIAKNPAMKNPDAMGMQNFINAIPFSETKNYVAKIHRQTGGVQVQRSVPGVPKEKKGTSKTSQSAPQSVRTVRGYTANVDKGFEKALKLGKSYGIKADAASTAQLSQASSVVKGFAKANSYDELESAYIDAVNKAVKAIPERERKKLSNAQKKDIGSKMVLTMAGASSHAELLEIVYAVNRKAIPIEGSFGPVKAGGLTLPGQQPSSTQSPQVSKLQALYQRSGKTSAANSSFESIAKRKQQEAADAFNGSGKTTAAAKKENPTTNNLRNANAALDWD